MAKNANFVSHKKSKQIVNGKPKLPLATDLVEGEIAINFGKDVETLSIKNESGDVVTFSSDNYYTEQKLGSGFTGENSGVTVTDAILWVSGTGENSVVLKGSSGTASGGYSVAEGHQTSATSQGSHAEGSYTRALGDYSHAEGNSSQAIGNNSHAEGIDTRASGDDSHAEGVGTIASGSSSHAEGNWTTASGNYSHAEGDNTTASGYSSHAEGYSTQANGSSSHVEGVGTTASGDYSHAEGYYTITYNKAEHASGQYNVSSSASTTFGDSGNTLFSVGNGISSANKHNAFEIRQNGDIYIVSGGTDILLQDNLGGGSGIVDQVIDETTSASTHAVATKAVYGFVTSYTPSITVDQDFSNTASTNPISTKAVYSAVTDNELVWTNAFVALSGTVSAHTENTEIHVTATDKAKLHTHTNKTALDSITGNVGTMAYEDNASYSSATEVNTALGGKANTANTLAGYGIADAYTKSETSGATELTTAFAAKANTTDLANFFDDAKYEDSGNTKVINFYHGNTIKATIDASDFIVDGMVDDVRIENGNLVIDFNTASGKEDISIPLTDIFDPSNYYNKTAIDNLVGSGFTSSSITDVIIENEEIVSNALTDLDERKLDASAYTPTDLSNYYTKSETSGATELTTAFSAKANTATTLAGYGITDAYTKSETSGATEISNALGGKVNSATFTGHTADTTVHFTTGTVQTQIDNSISGKVNTSDIISAITPSNSGSTAPIATKVVAENELIVSNALTDLDERKLDASAYTPTDLSNYYTKSETSGATEISNALAGKSDTGHTHVSSGVTAMTGYAKAASGSSIATGDTLNQAIGKLEAYVDDLNSQSETIAAALVDLSENKADTTTVTAHTSDTNIHLSETDRLIRDTLTRRTRKDFTASGMTYFVNTLKSAIADQCLEKYGMKVGDYYSVTHDGKTYNYVIAGLNTMKGTSTPYRLNINHIGIIVDTNDNHAWNKAGNTYTSQNSYSTGGTWTTGSSAAGYANCDLHYYLTNTVLPNVKTDLGSGNIKNHYKLYSTAVNTSGYNRFGGASGCASSWAWYVNQEICALSEVQVYGSTVWSSSGYDTGEACRQLDVFRVYNMNEIFEGRYPWLRDVASASFACFVNDNGLADRTDAHATYYVAALILFA